MADETQEKGTVEVSDTNRAENLEPEEQETVASDGDDDAVPEAAAVVTDEEDEDAGEPSSEAVIEALKKEIERLKEQTRDSSSRFLRACADLENFKKRSVREKQESVKFANKQIFLQTLHVLDNFERALAAVENPRDSFVIGVEMIRKQLQEVLTQNGVEEIDATGKPFDPYLHEAIAKESSDEFEDNVVMEVFQKGFRFQGILLRPAKVKVATDPEAEVSEAGEEKG